MHIGTCGSQHFRLDFDLDNAAFYDDDPRAEIRRILDDVALSIVSADSGTIRDINGNTIGSWRIS